MIAKRAAILMTVCVAAGGLFILPAMPAYAIARPAAVPGQPVLACTYRLTGACTPIKSWAKVEAANGKRGWAFAGYLRKVTK